MKALLPLSNRKGFEEVTETVFKVRDSIVKEDGTARYYPGHVLIGEHIEIDLDGISPQEISAIARFCGVQSGSANLINKVPQYVHVMKRKGGKMRLLDTKNGQEFRSV